MAAQGVGLHVHLDNNVVGGCGNGSLLNVESILRDPCADNGMEVRITRDQGDDTESSPFATSIWESQQGGKERNHPDLSKQAVERTLVEILGTVSETQHSDDLDSGRGSGKKVTGQSAEVADPLKSQSEIGLNRSGGDVCNKTDKV